MSSKVRALLDSNSARAVEYSLAAMWNSTSSSTRSLADLSSLASDFSPRAAARVFS